MSKELSNIKAIQFMLLSTLAFASMNGIIKYLEVYHAFQVVFFRSIGSLIISYCYLKINKIPIWGTHKKLLITRGVLGVSAMTFFFIALQLLPFATAISMRYLSPIFAAIFAIYVLKERVYLIQWIFFFLAFLGVLILKGFDIRVTGIGILFIIISAFLSGAVYVSIRKIGNKEHPVVIVFYFMLIATIFGSISSIPYWKVPTSFRHWILLIFLGFFGYLGQLFMTKAFQGKDTTLVAPLKYLEIVFALIFGLLFLGETYTWISLFGILVIILPMIANLFYKNIRNKRHL